MGICRNAEKIYQLISLEGVSKDALLDISAQDDNGEDVPAKVFRDTPTEAVVVLVDVHSNTSNISYTIYASDGAIQNAGAWFEVGAASVNLRDAKLQSRMNYRVHKDLTTRIRNSDNGRQFLFSPTGALPSCAWQSASPGARTARWPFACATKHWHP